MDKRNSHAKGAIDAHVGSVVCERGVSLQMWSGNSTSYSDIAADLVSFIIRWVTIDASSFFDKMPVANSNEPGRQTFSKAASIVVSSKKYYRHPRLLREFLYGKNVVPARLSLVATLLSDEGDTVDRRLAEEDDELSEVQPDAVPPEVREWLASTFTRQLATTRRRADEKPKFRSVAHAIRAGIFVDRMYRRVGHAALMQFPAEVVKCLKNLDDWTFDVFALGEAATGQPVKFIGYDLLNRYGMIHKFKVPPAVLEQFLVRIEDGYQKYRNPYHNNLHAADVCQTVHYMLCQTGLMNWMTDLEIFATLIAALIHDYEHTGTTNNFHVMSGSETALLYNDRAVLENHHVSAAFRLMRDDPDSNILQNLGREELREFRTLVIDMVLATDMSYHFQQLKTMRGLISLALGGGGGPAVGEHGQPIQQPVGPSAVDKSKALSLVLHTCDISHPAKQWKVHHRWTTLLLEEFFRQGDMERELGLPFSPLCDRNNTLVAESQIGFIDFIVEPSMGVCTEMLEVVLGSGTTPNTDLSKPWVRLLQENKKVWKDLAAKGELTM